jgi:hypothetical protein
MGLPSKARLLDLTFRMRPNGRLHVGPRELVRDDDLTFMRHHREALIACVNYLEQLDRVPPCCRPSFRTSRLGVRACAGAQPPTGAGMPPDLFEVLVVALSDALIAELWAELAGTVGSPRESTVQ